MYTYIYIYIERERDRDRWIFIFVNCLNMLLTSKSPQARHAETDPRHGTPTMAHFQPPATGTLYVFVLPAVLGCA